MSNAALNAVFSRSESTGIARNVMVVIADSANVHGLSWLPLEPPKWKGANPEKCIVHMARTKTRRQAIRAIQELEQLGEIQVRKAQRGQRRHNVYRLMLADFPLSEIRWEDLPFELLEPFADDQPTDLRRDGVSRRSGEPVVPLRGDTSVTSPGDQGTPRDVTPIRARELDPSGEPSDDPAAEPQEDHLDPTFEAQLVHGGDRSGRSAAASESEPVSIEQAVAQLSRLHGWDVKSIDVVQPLLWRVPASVVVETLDKTLARKSRNQTGLFVHLLQVAIEQWRAEQAEARLETWNEFFGEKGLERVKREDPERYVLAWATPALEASMPLPPNVVCAHVIGYVFDYVDDPLERQRLIRRFAEATDHVEPARQAYRDIENAVLMALSRNPLRPYDEVVQMIETFTDGSPEARTSLLTFAAEIHANVQRELGEQAA